LPLKTYGGFPQAMQGFAV